MAIIRLKGGLGNQMFQYAMGRAMAVKMNCPVYFDDSFYTTDKSRKFGLELFGCDVQKATQREIDKYDVIRRLLYKIKGYVNFSRLFGYQFEKHEFEYDSYDLKGYLDGYWQNEKYFSNVREILRDEFVYTGELTEVQRKIISEMHENDSIALHVRRGDYLDDKNKGIYVCLPIVYYQNALTYILSEVTNPSIYVFSDDIPWCKNHFAEYRNFKYIDDEISSSAVVDFELMRNCKNFIIANSTFSWWPAWLSKNKGKYVIAPRQWFYNEEQNQRVIQGLCAQFKCM